MRKTAGYTWIDRKTNTEIAKDLNITPVLDKIQECRRKCLQLVNRKPRHRLQGIIKKLQTKKQKEPGVTIQDTSGFVRPERVNQWPNSMLARFIIIIIIIIIITTTTTTTTSWVLPFLFNYKNKFSRSQLFVIASYVV